MNNKFVVVKQATRITSSCCRLCLVNGFDLRPLQDLTVDSHAPNEPVSLTLSQLIVRYLSIELLLESTSYICSECRNTIAKWHWFRESCLQNDGVYQKMAQDPEINETAGQTDEYYEVVVKQEQEIDIDEEDFKKNLIKGSLDALPEGCSTKVITKKSTPAKGKREEPPAKKKPGRPPLPESEKKSKGQPQMCTICGKEVKNLAGHMTIHNQERSHQCPHCSLSFHHKHNLEKHVNIHTKERKFICPVCDKTFLRSDNLKMHMHSHSSERTFKCPYCPKAYRMRAGLLVHRKTHTQMPDIQCNGCEKKFYTKSQMQKHAVRHLAVKSRSYIEKNLSK